jgi:hypothetical protein
MQRQHLKLVAAAEAPAAPEQEQEEPLLHLRITGRHGVFLLQRGENQVALVDTRTSGAIACTCRKEDGTHEDDCEHVAILRACGFLQAA